VACGALALACPGGACASAAPCPGATLRPTATNAAATGTATLCLVNRIRAGAHVPALRANRELATVAQGQVRRMVRFDYFADVPPSGGPTPLALVANTRYPAHAAAISVGQNIAWGTGAYATPAQVVAAWMGSPPHRAIILDASYRDTGVAVAAAAPAALAQGLPGATYAMEFATRHR
jgi:uncharacterized protein YkwD